MKFTSLFGLQPKPDQSMSRVEILSGMESFCIERNAGPKRIPSFRRRGVRREKTMLRCNSICAAWSRLPCNQQKHPGNKPAPVLRKTEYPVAIRNLIAQLRQMPGVGPRSAERIALWTVRARSDQPEQIARAISETRRGIHPCKLCGYFTSNELCDICSDSSRAIELLCVVEQPTDILPLEKTGAFRGRYHSLGGRISPLDHIGPEDLRIKELLDRVESEKFSEIIFALAADVEGEATTNYLVDLLKGKPIALTRIARGLPAGAGLESADELTLQQALTGRTKIAR